MDNGIRASDLRWLNKGSGSKYHVGSRVRQETPEEGWRTYQPKRCEHDNKDEDNCPKSLNFKNKKDQNLSSTWCCSYSRLLNEIKKWKDWQVLGSCWKTEKGVEHKGNDRTDCCWSLRKSLEKSPQKPGKENGTTGDQRKNQDRPKHSSVKICLNT